MTKQKENMMKLKVLCAAVLTLLTAMMQPMAAQEADVNVPTEITLKITNRMHANYLEYMTTEIGDTIQVGDTDFFFTISEFFAHFAMIDSTKEIVSLSDELKNPAFRIDVFENEDLADKTWAFYLIRVPHFGQNSYMAFEVMEFTYRGEHHTLETEGNTLESE